MLNIHPISLLTAIYLTFHVLSGSALIVQMRRGSVLHAIRWRLDAMRQAVGIVLLLVTASLIHSLGLPF